jgi:hypothetical protein
VTPEEKPEDQIPYDPWWWAEFNHKCDQLTDEDIDGMMPRAKKTKDKPGMVPGQKEEQKPKRKK